MQNEDFVFMDNTGHIVELNYILAEEQSLSDHDMNCIIEEHLKRVKIFKQMEETDDKKTLRALAKKVEQIEYQLQELWRFEPNNLYHTWWHQVPKCKCAGPRSGYNIAKHEVTVFRKIADDCIIHGK